MNGSPLNGVQVLEAASYVSGPFAAQMLVDLGAEVIKIEGPPRGDASRRIGRPTDHYSATFANCNRGKQSLNLDLKDPAQRDHLLDLVKTADVWITNWRPGVAERLGLDDEILAARNPSLIRLYLTGYGRTGSRATAPAFDTIVQAASGMTDALARGERPFVLPGYPVDKLTAGMATQAVLAALFARERHGRGERIDMSMLAAASYVNFVELFVNRTFTESPSAEARALHATRSLPTQDGWMVTTPVAGLAIRNVCELVGHPEWGPELRALPDQTKMAGELFDRLERVLPSRPTDEWVEMFQARDVPAARCLTIDEHLADPQVAVEDIYQVEDWGPVGSVRTVRYPAVFASVGRMGAPGPAPRFGGRHGQGAAE